MTSLFKPIFFIIFITTSPWILIQVEAEQNSRKSEVNNTQEANKNTPFLSKIPAKDL